MLSRLRYDRRGASLVTYVFVLPLFIVLVFGVMELWEVMTVRQSFSLEVYRAARKLSTEGRAWNPMDPGRWESIATVQARESIRAGLDDNEMIPAGYTLNVQVTLEPEPDTNPAQLGWFFVLRAEVTVPDLINLPFLDYATLTFAERQTSYIEGVSGLWSPPTPAAPY